MSELRNRESKALKHSLVIASRNCSFSFKTKSSQWSSSMEPNLSPKTTLKKRGLIRGKKPRNWPITTKIKEIYKVPENTPCNR